MTIEEAKKTVSEAGTEQGLDGAEEIAVEGEPFIPFK